MNAKSPSKAKSQVEQENKKRKIVFVEGNPDGTIGGSYFSLLFLVSGLDRSRFKPIVVFRKPHSLLSRYEQTGAKVHIIAQPSPVTLGAGSVAPTSPFHAFLRLLQKGTNFSRGFLLEALRLALWLRNQRADLLHLNNSVTRNHDWILGAWLAGVPCVTHERGINQQFSALSKFFARRLQRIICISRAVLENLTHSGVGADNLCVIYNGIAPDVMQPTESVEALRTQWKIPPESPVIGIVGNIKEWKGQEVVVRAVERLKRVYPRLICLIVGDTSASDLYYLRRLQLLISELALDESVIFTGYKTNVADYMNAMDIVIHASVDPEPFGRVLIEAMALRKPVVGSRAGAVPELLDEPNCGLTFTPGDSEELANRLASLLTDASRRHAMGEAGRLRVETAFGIERNVRETEKVYDEVLST